MAKDGISKQEAIQKLLQETQPKKIISVRLGMEKIFHYGKFTTVLKII